MRDVRDEALLHAREILELADLLADTCGHLVERCGELSEVISTLDLHTFTENTLGESAGGRCCRTHRVHDLSSHQPGDEHQQADEQQARAEYGAPDEIKGLLLLLERKQVVQLVGSYAGDRDRCAHHETWLSTPIEIVDRGVRPGLALRLGDGSAQIKRNRGDRNEIRAAFRSANARVRGQQQDFIVSGGSRSRGKCRDDGVDKPCRSRRRRTCGSCIE